MTATKIKGMLCHDIAPRPGNPLPIVFFAGAARGDVTLLYGTAWIQPDCAPFGKREYLLLDWLVEHGDVKLPAPGECREVELEIADRPTTPPTLTETKPEPLLFAGKPACYVGTIEDSTS